MFDPKFVPARVTQLRTQKDVSAREMSLAIGQNEGYIQNIESGKTLPSMMGFLYICEYLKISPSDFFDTGTRNPGKLQALTEDLKMLDDAQLENIHALVKGLIKK